jgi:hypothetical protein
MTVHNARKVTSFFARQKAIWVPVAFLVDLVLDGSSGQNLERTFRRS